MKPRLIMPVFVSVVFGLPALFFVLTGFIHGMGHFAAFTEEQVPTWPESFHNAAVALGFLVSCLVVALCARMVIRAVSTDG